MNYIKQLLQDLGKAQAAIRQTRDQLIYLEVYLTSSKFAAPDCDYVHVRTDILPKLSAIRFDLCGQ